MTCDEQRLAAFLAGDLDPAEREAIDAHLVGCDGCWRAVREDRAGRDAAIALRALPSAELAESVRRAVDLTATAPVRRPGPRPFRRRLWFLVPVAAALVVSLGAFFTAGGGGEPSLEQAVAHAAGAGGVSRIDAFAVGGEQLVVAHPSMVVPAPAEASGGHAGGDRIAWEMHDHGITIICAERTGVLLAGKMSAQALLAAATALGLV